jgi:hypothetical protein
MEKNAENARPLRHSTLQKLCQDYSLIQGRFRPEMSIFLDGFPEN